MTSILITGGAGRIAAGIRPLLRREGREVVLFDLHEPDDALREGERVVRGSVVDRAALDRALVGVDLVVHLGGLASEAPWREILAVNIDGTQAVLERAHAHGVRRVLLASSIHAAGYLSLVQLERSDEPPVRPDSYYGVGKVALEALGSLFADRYGMTVVSARIASYAPRPANPRALALWCAPEDVAALVEATLTTDEPGHRIVWAVSANTRGRLPLDRGAAVGFVPSRDAEGWASEFDPGEIELAIADGVLAAGGFIDRPLGAAPPTRPADQ